jgi:hypothetical protein
VTKSIYAKRLRDSLAVLREGGKRNLRALLTSINATRIDELPTRQACALAWLASWESDTVDALINAFGVRRGEVYQPPPAMPKADALPASRRAVARALLRQAHALASDAMRVLDPVEDGGQQVAEDIYAATEYLYQASKRITEEP